MSDKMNIILASASPRRKELLEGIGLRFSVIPSHADESVQVQEPALLVCELSAKKAYDIYGMFPGSLIIGADTVVSVDGNILGKPRSEDHAREMLGMLSGKKHEVFTGLTLIFPDGTSLTECCRSAVYFKTLSKSETDAYLSVGEYSDKAGAYAIQGRAAVFVEKIEGCYSNIVGLPLPTFYRMLDKKGVNLWQLTI